MPAPSHHHRHAVVTAAYASSLVDYLLIQGIDPAPLYARAGLPSFELIAQRGQITIGEWMQMFDLAADALGDPDLALQAGAHLNIRHMGVLGQVLMNCPTLAEAATQLARYIRLLGEFGQPRVESRDGRAHLLWTWPYASEPPQALIQFMQAARASMTRWLTGRPDMQAEAHFSFAAPDDCSVYRRIFGGPLRFGQPVNQLIVPDTYLRAPIVLADADRRSRAELDASALLEALSGDAEFTQRLRAAVLDRLERGQATLDAVAGELVLTPRTLQRRLDREGRSFREVLHEVRLARAQQCLSDPALRLAEVAFLLGYAEQSAFQYAFKRWTGLTPGQYRRRQLGAA
ncbi:MAG: AraC family transcriptional regulator [Nevskiales bacterium]|nr:AraC family transcriptional regulator [Nevskiales bacterium]